MILFYRINGLGRYGKRSVFDEFENEQYIVEQSITPLKSIFSNAEMVLAAVVAALIIEDKENHRRNRYRMRRMLHK